MYPPYFLVHGLRWFLPVRPPGVALRALERSQEATQGQQLQALTGHLRPDAHGMLGFLGQEENHKKNPRMIQGDEWDYHGDYKV